MFTDYLSHSLVATHIFIPLHCTISGQTFNVVMYDDLLVTELQTAQDNTCLMYIEVETAHVQMVADQIESYVHAHPIVTTTLYYKQPTPNNSLSQTTISPLIWLRVTGTLVPNSVALSNEPLPNRIVVRLKDLSIEEEEDVEDS